MTLAVFHIRGKVSVFRQRLNSFAKDGEITLAAALRTLTLILSEPVAFIRGISFISYSTSEIVMSGMSKDESLYNGRSGWIGLSISISLLAMLAKFWFSVSAISSFFVSRVWLIIISFTRIGSFALPDKVFKIFQSFFGFLRFSVRNDLKWICLAFLME